MALIVSAALGGATAVAPAPAAEWPVVLYGKLLRLATVEARLGAQAQDRCPAQIASFGLILDHRSAYRQSDWPILQRSVGLDDGLRVAAVVEGSPSDLAGIAVGNRLLAIDGQPVEDLWTASARRTVPFADAVHADLAARSPGRPVSFAIRRGMRASAVSVTPQIGCGTRLVYKSGSARRIYSDSRNVAISDGMVDFAASDAELALIAAHEYAHVINRDGKASGLAGRRAMEDRADLEGAMLALCAGYDVAGATAFWERFAAHDGADGFRLPTHRSSRERAALLRVFLAGRRCDRSYRAPAP